MKERVKITFCIEAVVRWEQMTQRSFSTIDFGNEEDSQKLLYCSYILGVDAPPSFSEFQLMLTNKRFSRMFVQAMERYNRFLAQFSAHKEQSATEEQEQSHDATIGDIAAKLIVSGGLDARFVMREMLIEDMPMFIKALEDKTRQEEESRRLWTYFSILPHIDSKKCPSPDKMLIFPWEQERQRAEAARVAEENKAEFEKFMRGGNLKQQDNGRE